MSFKTVELLTPFTCDLGSMGSWRSCHTAGVEGSKTVSHSFMPLGNKRTAWRSSSSARVSSPRTCQEMQARDTRWIVCEVHLTHSCSRPTAAPWKFTCSPSLEKEIRSVLDVTSFDSSVEVTVELNRMKRCGSQKVFSWGSYTTSKSRSNWNRCLSRRLLLQEDGQRRERVCPWDDWLSDKK